MSKTGYFSQEPNILGEYIEHIFKAQGLVICSLSDLRQVTCVLRKTQVLSE